VRHQKWAPQSASFESQKNLFGDLPEEAVWV